jgi:hypothetical protein
MNAQYGGSTNDAFIWRYSHAKEELQRRFDVNQERGEWLLGKLYRNINLFAYLFFKYRPMHLQCFKQIVSFSFKKNKQWT